jgi:hypothetical protein
VSKLRRKKPAPRNAHKPPDTYDFIQHCARLLKARVAAGVYRDRPGLEAAIVDFDPAIALIEIAADPANTVDLRAPAAAKLLPYWHKEQSLLVKEAGGGNAPVSIQIIVPQWASGKPAAPALAAPETIIEAGTPQTNGTPPAPRLSDQQRLREQVRAQRETIVVDAPARPDQPQHVIGRVNQGHPYELSKDEKRDIMERLLRRPQ